ncbi:TlpA disulfide reductase family protein [Tsuneonella sp. CC-YZS046]|uniref:TlpA family protein disulfide reductase n=1 Tax=Tsuneonella sp. CC-YZS046 TaxID=3042152 RepID=UPI002D777B3A|nr:TlpA disulfide reductase family protein [Tsuneonella sp. CC-YZS046]WRO67332.1 TlpA disulfide reductase family protein [Tsuneonella sp. CC-YZS046]
MPSLSLTLAVLGLAVINGGCDRQSQPPAQPAAKEQANAGSPATAAGSPDRSHAGSRLPDFTFADPNGQKLHLPELQGTPALINLWATWCAPCVKEMPLLDDLASRMQGKLRVVTISQDMQGAAKVAPFFKQNGYRKLEPWLDPENELAFHYGGANLPMTLLYDAQGREVWRIAGDFDWSGAEAQNLVGEALVK